MLFYWFPFEDGLAIQSKWVDGGWMAPGVYYGVAVIAYTGSSRTGPLMGWEF